MSKKYYLLIYILLILLIAASVVFILKSLGINLIKTNTISTQNAYVKANIAQISPEISAKISAIYAKDFASVKKGELLFELDCADYELAARKAQIELDRAKSLVKKAELAKKLSEQECKQTDFSAQAASAKAASAASEFNRVSKMFKSGAASNKAYESAKEAAASSSANLAAAKSKQAACKIKQDELVTEYKLAELAKENATNALELAGRNISRCKIYAPDDGNLAQINAGLGELVGPNKVLSKLISTKRWVQANIKESDLDGLKIGDRVSFLADGSSEEFSGKVEQISAATGNEIAAMKMDNSVGNFIKITQRVPVIISIDKGANNLASGQSLRLKIYKNER